MNVPLDSSDIVTFREEVTSEDPARVREIVASTGYFRPDETDVAVELVTERLAKGLASGYRFLFAQLRGRVAGYACYGPIACTLHSYDEYWIVVHQDFRGRGLGKRLQKLTEERIAGLGGRRIYIETSTQPKYEPTRRFYLSCGYTVEAVLDEFYAPGDGKMILLKVL